MWQNETHEGNIFNMQRSQCLNPGPWCLLAFLALVNSKCFFHVINWSTTTQTSLIQLLVSGNKKQEFISCSPGWPMPVSLQPLVSHILGDKIYALSLLKSFLFEEAQSACLPPSLPFFLFPFLPPCLSPSLPSFLSHFFSYFASSDNSLNAKNP